MTATARSLDEVLARGAEHAVVDDGPDPEAAERVRRRRAVVERCGFGLPAEVAELVISDRLYSTRPLELAKAWLRGPREVFLAIGKPGTGKSVACIWAALERLDEGPFVYVLESTLAEWRWYRTRHAAELEELREAATVLIDEAGMTEGPRREIARIAVAELVHQRMGVLQTGRYRRRRRTLLTGNLSLDELAERFDPRLLDRLVQVATLVHETGPSLRGRR